MTTTTVTDFEHDYDEEPDEPFTDGPLKGRMVRSDDFPTPLICRADDADQSAIVVMYGDDARHTVERDTLTLLDDDADFCLGCGSFACGHGR